MSPCNREFSVFFGVVVSKQFYLDLEVQVSANEIKRSVYLVAAHSPSQQRGKRRKMRTKFINISSCTTVKGSAVNLSG